MKTARPAFLAAFLLAACAACGAVPLSWTVEATRVQPVVFDCYHGEELALEVLFNARGKPLETGLQAALYWQTNGMGAAWWTAPAACASNAITATWKPSFEPGDADRVKCFLGSTGATWRAEFTLRFKGSPGATPNVLPLPAVTYDAALTGEPTLNGTNLTEWIVARSTQENDPLFTEWAETNDLSKAAGVTPQAVSNIVSGFSFGVDSNEVARIVTNEVAYFTPWVADTLPQGVELYGQPYFSEGLNAWLWDSSNETFSGGEGKYKTSATFRTINDTMSFTATRRVITVNALSLARLADVADATNAAVARVLPVATNAYATATNVARQVSQWNTYWDGDDVRVTVTNYDSQTTIPSLYLEQKVTEGGSNYFKRVWDERTRWNAFTPGYTTFTNATVAALDDKADRAWGCYDSTTGEYAPDGYTWISSSNVAICADMAWQRTITTSGNAVWILSSTGLDTVVSGTEAGKFSISDDEGNALFSVVKGDKVTVGATASSNVVSQAAGGGTEMRVFYAVDAAAHPAIYATTNLANAVWTSETASDFPGGSVTWSGTNKAYWATLDVPAGVTPLFVKATMEVGGSTYVRHDAPIGVFGGMTVTNKDEGGYITVYPKWNGTTVVFERNP